MKLTVLGSGTAEPHPKRSSAGFWLESAGRSLMLDCSAPAVHRAAQEGFDWANLNAVWISHFHLDHVAGLPAYLFATRHAFATQGRSEPLRIFGGKGLKALIGKFDAVNDYKLLQQPFPLEIVEIEPLERFEIFEGLDAVAMDSPHTDESHAIHLTGNGGRTLVYTADTGFSEKIGTFARNADLFVLECSFVKDKPVEIHLELAEAMHLVRYARPKKAMLTHFYAEWDSVDFTAEIEKYSPGCEVIQAEDGLRIEV